MLQTLNAYYHAGGSKINSLMNFFSRRFSDNWVIVTNASSLVGTTAITSGLGFIYWWVAARTFLPDAVGLASASISAMTFLANASILGFGTLLIGELPRQPRQKMSLIVTAMLFVGIVGGLFGSIFALLTPWISIDLSVLAQNGESIALFAVGVSLTAITVVTDQAMIGLLRGELQFGRNVLFAAAKLIALAAAGVWLANGLGQTIYATWALGNLISLLALAMVARSKGIRLGDCLPRFGLVRKLGRAAVGHHLLNLSLQTPTLLLPVIVTVMLSARMNAYFYAAWMLAYFGFAGLLALSTVLYAVGSKEPAVLASKIRMTLQLSALIALLENIVLLIGAEFILNFFGSAYADQAGWSLRLLGLAAFPFIIRNHYVTLSRMRGQLAGVALFMLAGGLLELVLAALGAQWGGLTYLCLGWLVALCIESAFMVKSVYQVATAHKITTN